MAKIKIVPATPAAEAEVLRFGIGEWYGHSFAHLSAKDRKELAEFEPDKGSRLEGGERLRLAALSAKQASGKALTKNEEERLKILAAKKAEENGSNAPCPFKEGYDNDICTKDGGVCSFRLYRKTSKGVEAVEGTGAIRAMCPARFYEGGEVHAWVGETLLGDSAPSLAREVGFLESTVGPDTEESADVGRIDMVLVNHDREEGRPLQWCALEIQAVYFSGKKMEKEFAAIAAYEEDEIPFPNANRRPDYRSSGPKRLMPQLQIKVPSLRRWGKKMAVVVDEAFFNALGTMQTVDDVSNCDIAWFVVDFEYSKDDDRFKLVRRKVVYTTLEHSVDGLTGGHPVPLGEFEKRIITKLPDAEA